MSKKLFGKCSKLYDLAQNLNLFPIVPIEKPGGGSILAHNLQNRGSRCKLPYYIKNGDIRTMEVSLGFEDG